MCKADQSIEESSLAAAAVTDYRPQETPAHTNNWQRVQRLRAEKQNQKHFFFLFEEKITENQDYSYSPRLQLF